MKTTIALQIIWSISAKEALVADFEYIEIEHFFNGYLKFIELEVEEFEMVAPYPDLAESLLEEKNALIKYFTSLGITIPGTGTSIRRRLRQKLGYGGYPSGDKKKIHRSKKLRDVFHKAEEIAQNRNLEELSALEFLVLLMDSIGDVLFSVFEEFGIEKKSLENQYNSTIDIVEKEKNILSSMSMRVDISENSLQRDSIKRVARHKAGHVILSYFYGNSPGEINISDKDYSEEYIKNTLQSDTIYTKPELEKKICELMAGRGAEIIYYGAEEGLSTLVSEDLKDATLLAINMIKCFGMSRNFGQITLDKIELQDGPLTLKVYEEAHRIISEQMKQAIKILEEKRHYLNELSEKLLYKNQLSQEEIKSILEVRSEQM